MARSAVAPGPKSLSERGDPLIRRAELVISYVLRGGVMLSAAFITLGVIMAFHNYLTQPSRQLVNTNAFPYTIGSVLHGVLIGDAQAIIMLGLLLLLATPVVRVAVSIIAFGLERDWRYVDHEPRLAHSHCELSAWARRAHRLNTSSRDKTSATSRWSSWLPLALDWLARLSVWAVASSSCPS